MLSSHLQLPIPTLSAIGSLFNDVRLKCKLSPSCLSQGSKGFKKCLHCWCFSKTDFSRDYILIKKTKRPYGFWKSKLEISHLHFNESSHLLKFDTTPCRSSFFEGNT